MESLIDGILQYSRAGRVTEPPSGCRHAAGRGGHRSAQRPRTSRSRSAICRSLDRRTATAADFHEPDRQRAEDTARTRRVRSAPTMPAPACDSASATTDRASRPNTRPDLGNVSDPRIPRQGRGNRDRTLTGEETGRGPGRPGLGRVAAGAGATFTFSGRNSAAPRTVRLSDEKALNILLVEDDHVDVMNVRARFERNRITNPLFVAPDGLEGSHAARGASSPRAPAHPAGPQHAAHERHRVPAPAARRSGPSQLPRSLSSPRPTTNATRSSAYNLNVAGYLLKPVTFVNFVEVMAALNSTGRSSNCPEMAATPPLLLVDDDDVDRLAVTGAC